MHSNLVQHSKQNLFILLFECSCNRQPLNVLLGGLIFNKYRETLITGQFYFLLMKKCSIYLCIVEAETQRRREVEVNRDKEKPTKVGEKSSHSLTDSPNTW